MTFSERLMQLRKQRGWSQEQLGEQLHVTRQTISKWETGATTPELNKLIELSELFDLSIDELVGRTSSAQPEQTISYAARFPQAFFEYKSKRMLFGMPLVHINIGHGHIGGIGFKCAPRLNQCIPTYVGMAEGFSVRTGGGCQNGVGRERP